MLKSKLFLLLVAFLAYVGLIFLSPRFEGDTMLYLFAFLINVGMAITPTWFFQGMESMWWVALINVVMKVLAALFILLLAVGSSDYNLYVLLMLIVVDKPMELSSFDVIRRLKHEFPGQKI